MGQGFQCDADPCLQVDGRYNMGAWRRMTAAAGTGRGKLVWLELMGVGPNMTDASSVARWASRHWGRD